jgi:MoaA/NifB/PqqE/SkfB family radical SAM enzyme
MKLYNLVDFRNLKPCGKLTERTRLFTGYACNIKCKFCFYKGKKHVDINKLIAQQIVAGKKFGIKDWDISGGEPSILPYWFVILKILESMGFRNIACITNGYKFADQTFLRESMSRGLNELLFSLHGSNAEIHDKMTDVKGSYDKLTKAISNAVYYGTKIRINVVVTKDNYKDLPKIAEYAKHLKPIAFNFLPFRLENSASKKNAVRYTNITPYIKEAINILLGNKIKIAIRYVPFCLFEGYEKNVAGYLQRAFDEFEWNEYTIRHFEAVRFNREPSELDCVTDKWKLEIESLHSSIKHVANHSTKCLACKYLHVCDGIWKSYAKVWGIDEFKPIEGEKTKRICQ